MKIIRPESAGPSQGVRHGSSTHQRPGWLAEWIKNQGRYVRLTCGHTDDLNDQTTKPIRWKGWKTIAVLCQHCDEWSDVKEHIGLLEKMNIKPPVQSDTPPF